MDTICHSHCDGILGWTRPLLLYNANDGVGDVMMSLVGNQLISLICFIIIIMTRRQLWSVAMTLRDVHVPLRSATFVSSWTEFPRRPAVSMSF